MLSLAYEGWFECRIPTDPDPSDEPRGVSGWTFAVAGEPDLDRIIHLQRTPAVNRPYGVSVGVKVTSVSLFGGHAPGHYLEGAEVELLDNPVFEGRNGIVAEDALEPIVPYHIRIRKGGVVLRREHRNPTNGELVYDPPTGGLGQVPQDVANALGTADARAWRAKRKDVLQQALVLTVDPVEQEALRKRIRDIERSENGERTTPEVILQFTETWRIVLNGPYVEIRDSEHRLEGTIDTSAWVSSFWAGAYDADALCGYMKGTLDIPFRPNS